MSCPATQWRRASVVMREDPRRFASLTGDDITLQSCPATQWRRASVVMRKDPRRFASLTGDDRCPLLSFKNLHTSRGELSRELLLADPCSPVC